MPPILRLRADGVLPHLPRGGAAICRTATRKIRKGIIDPIMRKSGKRLTLILLVLYLASAAVYGGARWYISREGDSSCPVISFDKDIIEVSVSDPDEKLLRGVSAYDKKDGDVSGSLVIESRSALLGGSERIVTYAAFDSDNNVGKGQRRIRYTDYVSPRLSLDAPLTVTSSSTPAAELVAKIHADDCIDGDISDEIVVLSSKEEITVGDAQLRILEIQVTNSCGDIVGASLPVLVDPSIGSHNAKNSVKLEKYLVYAEKGADLDPRSLVTEATVDGIAQDASQLSVSSNLDTAACGTYAVIFTAGEGDAAARVPLTVIVTD